MSDNPQYAHVHVKQQKGLKQKMQHHKGAGEPLPEQMELLALSSDSCSTYPPERTSPSLSANVLSPTNNSVFNYNQIPNQQRHAGHQHQQQQQQQQRNIIYQANNQVHLHSNGITPQMIQPQHPPNNNPGQMNPLHVAQQLSPPHTLHPNQQMSTQLQHAVQQHKQQQRYQQQHPHLVQQQQQQQQPIYNQSISPNSIPSEPAEIIKVLSQALVGQQQLQHQQQAQLFSLHPSHQSRHPPTAPSLQMSHQNDLLKRRLSRWERLTNQNRNYLLSLNNKEDQFRAICALSLLAVPEPQY